MRVYIRIYDGRVCVFSRHFYLAYAIEIVLNFASTLRIDADERLEVRKVANKNVENRRVYATRELRKAFRLFEILAQLEHPIENVLIEDARHYENDRVGCNDIRLSRLLAIVVDVLNAARFFARLQRENRFLGANNLKD